MTIAFGEKIQAKSCKCTNCPIFATPLFVAQMYTFATHLPRAKKNTFQMCSFTLRLPVLANGK